MVAIVNFINLMHEALYIFSSAKVGERREERGESIKKRKKDETKLRHALKQVPK